MLEADFTTLVQAIGGFLVVLLSWGFTEAIKLLRRKSKSQLLTNCLQRLGWAVQKAVRGVYQEYVAAIKEGAADGKLTQAEKDEAKKRALIKLKSYVSLSEIVKLFELTDGHKVDEFLSSVIEAGVNEVKKASSVNPTT